MSNPVIDNEVAKAFDNARHPGLLHLLKRIVQRRPNKLHDFNAVREHLPVSGQHEGGLQLVPMEKIVGSVGRTSDFDREFRPRNEHTRDRWKRVARIIHEGGALPPIELLKVGEFYFVVDGNHRVSVMREQGQLEVEAHVTEVETPLDIDSTAEFRRLVKSE